ncbi:MULTISPECIES: GrpB family protein [Roseibium]|uniref:GrpB family protein n=1 Tax=Roseibium TaxID=150830 RepID=UPI003266A1E3
MRDEPAFNLVDTQDAYLGAERLFNEVRLLVADAVPHADIHHIGATAVPGCLTKGDLDIVVRVCTEKFEEADQALGLLYPRNLGSIRTTTFSAFEDSKKEPHLGVQLVAKDGPHDFFHQFAAALKASPDLLQAYNELKMEFAGRDMTRYRHAKNAFVERALADYCRRK